MKKIIGVLGLALVLNSCDDGDIIVTDFEIEDADLSVCGLDQKVIYATNNEGVFESLSLIVEAEAPINDSVSEAFINDVGNYEFSLSNDNQLIYRLYSSEIDGSEYFCSSVPPSSPQVSQEYISGTGGTVSVIVSYTDLTGEDADADQDGVPNILEEYNASPPLDTDGDGIPNYLDIDDDGDNVLTRDELDPEGGTWEEDGFLDTDQDGIPDYLDADDDNDGILTRNEVNPDDLDELEEDQWLRPQEYQTQAGLADYLNDQIQRNPENEENPTYVVNTITRNIITEISASGFSLTNEMGESPEINTNTRFILGDFTSSYSESLPNAYLDPDDEDDTDTDQDQEEEESGTETGN